MCFKSSTNTNALLGVNDVNNTALLETGTAASLDPLLFTAGNENLVVSPLGLLFLLATLIGGRATGGDTSLEIMRGLNRLADWPIDESLKAENSRLTDEAALRLSNSYEERLVRLLDNMLSDKTTAKATSNDNSVVMSLLQAKTTNKNTNSCLESSNFIICFTNMLFVEKTISLMPVFSDKMRNEFRFGLEKLDFSNTVDSANKINTWCKNQSKNNIKELISPEELPSNLKLGLFNAIYFKAKWLHPAIKTSKSNFWPTENKPAIDVNMMHFKERSLYYSDDTKQLEVVGKKLKDSSYIVLFIKSTQTHSLQNLEKDISSVHLQKNILHNLREANVYSQIPRFKIKSSINMIPLIKSFGIKQLFQENKADLRGISADAPDLFVGKVIQAAMLDVNEQGIEATAATGIMVQSRSMFFEEVTTVFDKPFLVSLVDGQTNNILFLARVVTPTILPLS